MFTAKQRSTYQLPWTHRHDQILGELWEVRSSATAPEFPDFRGNSRY